MPVLVLHFGSMLSLHEVVLMDSDDKCRYENNDCEFARTGPGFSSDVVAEVFGSREVGCLLHL